MKIATLNIQHGGGGRTKGILDYMRSLDVDCFVVTEYRANQNGLCDELYESGFLYLSTHNLDPKLNTVLIASRLPFAPLKSSQRIVSVEFQNLILIGVYFPQGEEKRSVFKELQELSNIENSVLIGDFNTGRHYLDEKGKTFACSECFEELEEQGWVDAWRSRNRHALEFSWYSSQGNGFRIDHVFCSEQVDKAITNIWYDPNPRLMRITDHSALIFELQIK